jgi:Flp pilus assembly protein TadG
MRPMMSFCHLLVRFRRDREGVSAVEFAMVLPLMITLFIGLVQVSDIASLKRKVSLVARATADLTAQIASINATEMTNVMNAGTSIIAPYPSGKLFIRIASLKIDANQNVTLAWTKINWNDQDPDPNKKAPSKCDMGSASTTLDPVLKIANTSLIMAEACYTYTPYVGFELAESLKIVPSSVKERIYMRPRLSQEVTWVN